MQTTRTLATAIGCTPQAINKAIRKACKSEDIDPETFGTPSDRDKRIRTFSESEVETILKYAPAPKAVSETQPPIVDGELIEPVTPNGLVVRSPNALMGFNVQTLNINLTLSNTTALDEECQQFKKQTAQALQGLKQITKDEIRADITEMRAQVKHAITGIQAIAVTEAVQDLVQPATQSQHQPQGAK